MRNIVSVLAIASFVFLACNKTATPVVVPPVSVVTPPLPSPKLPVAAWSLDTSDNWKRVHEAPLSDEPTMLARFESHEHDAVAYVVGQKLLDGAAKTFYADVAEAANDRPNARVVKDRKTVLAGREAYEVIDVRKRSDGVSIVISVAVSDGVIGYLVSCGGDLEEADEIMPPCQELVESFKINSN